jgi:purine-cytosine permease-like protein
VVDQQSFWIGFLTGRRRAQRGSDRPFVRTRPKMPSTPWRIAAVASVALGMLVAALVPAGSLLPNLIVGAVVGFVVGMYVVETVWERRVADRGGREGDQGG